MLAVPSPEPSPPPLFSSSLSSSSSSSSISKFLIVLLIIAFAIFASFSFHLLRHLLSRRRSSPTPPPTLQRCPTSPSESTKPSDHVPPSPSFPLLPVSSTASVLHKSPDCAVCLSPFRPRDELRLLPSCRHAFHLHCIDMWLRSTPSCPLCRSPAVPVEESGGSSSFEAEIDLSYSFRSSIEPLVDEEVEAAVDRVSITDQVKDDNGDEGGGRGWLRDYLDRVASSASSSFNSLTFSGRLSSHRFDSASIESVAAVDFRSWDMEGVEWAEESGLAGIYRWFVGM